MLVPFVSDVLAVASNELGQLTVGAIVVLKFATGMGTQYRETGAMIVWDHKTILSISSFLIIGTLLIAHFVSGVRGRLVTRVVLVAYLLLSLGYPGVKFVTDVLIGWSEAMLEGEVRDIFSR